jgi:hypothetical protein
VIDPWANSNNLSARENGSKVLEPGPWLIGGIVFILKKVEKED